MCLIHGYSEKATVSRSKTPKEKLSVNMDTEWGESFKKPNNKISSALRYKLLTETFGFAFKMFGAHFCWWRPYTYLYKRKASQLILKQKVLSS